MTQTAISYSFKQMHRSVCEHAPAKINLHLKVGERRADGFHNIESIFQKVSLYDELLTEMADINYTCQVVSPGFCLPQENTLTSAYKAFCECTGVSFGVRVTLKKNIPSGAGMGGGSSDAAAMLRCMEKLSGITLTADQKHECAAKIGSDVFFFLSDDADETAAVVTGRGENVRYITPRNDLFIVLVSPGVHSSTKEAYSLVDSYSSGTAADCTSLAELEAGYQKPCHKWNFYNSFTAPLKEKYPEIDNALQDMRSVNAGFADMTGSGSVVYGVFASRREAENANAQLSKKWSWCKTVTTECLEDICRSQKFVSVK